MSANRRARQKTTTYKTLFAILTGQFQILSFTMSQTQATPVRKPNVSASVIGTIPRHAMYTSTTPAMQHAT